MIKRFLSLSLLTILLYSCAEKEEIQKEQVSFSITPLADDDANGRTLAEVPAGTTLLISVADASGNPVLTHHRINLLHLGSGFITDPVTLAPGRYVLTDFMLVSPESEVLYATPKQNSKLSKAVSRPLPYSFVVGRNKVTTVDMQVIDAALNQPQDFGYAAFKISVVHPFQVAVFVRQGGQLVLTDAKAYIYNYDDYPNEGPVTFNLTATTNLISVKGGTESSYTLSIVKEGYNTYTKYFVYTELLSELGGQPLQVILEEPSLKYWNSDIGTVISYKESGTLYVDYGNGDTEVRGLNYRPEQEGETDGNWIYLSSILPPGISPVTVTGSLSAISGFYQYEPSNVDLSALKSLRSVTFEEGYIEMLDVSNSPDLRSLYLYNTTIVNLALPPQHKINYLFIAGQVTYRDQAINSVYNNAVAKNITNGWIDIDESLDPISEDIQAKLDELKNDYGWTIDQVIE